MRRALLLVLLIIVPVGCTAQALRRRTVNLADTWIDIHYRQVMENLAMVAANPDVLPSYSMLDYGTSTVTDKVGIVGSVATPAIGLVTGSTDPSVQRNVGQNWTLSQIAAPEKLRALRLAFRYAVFNDPNLLTLHDNSVTLNAFCYPDCVRKEASDEHCVCSQPRRKTSDSPSCDSVPGEPGYYFAVKDRLSQIPPGWLHIGTKHKVPKCARFTAYCGNTCVWVCEDDMESLSHFALIIQEIARDTVESMYYPKAENRTYSLSVPVFWNCSGGNTDALWVSGVGVQLPVDCYGNAVPQRRRLDGVAPTDNKLKSALVGAASSGS